MRLSETRIAPARTAGVSPRVGDDDAIQGVEQEAVAESRALVVVEPVAASEREHAANYRPASFLAHLIATKDLHPQTRARRRAAPAEAIAAYRAAQALMKH